MLLKKIIINYGILQNLNYKNARKMVSLKSRIREGREKYYLLIL